MKIAKYQIFALLHIQYSDEFRDFIKITLNKKPGMRSGAAELLEHPFLKK